MTPILIATVVLGGMGLLFGALIAVVNQRLAVPVDEKLAELRGALPGVNCGGCGYPGCDGYATALREQGCSTSLCPVGGDALAEKLAELLGVTADHAEKYVCTVMCLGDSDRCALKYEYKGAPDCRSASMVADGDKACSHSCLGFGCCERACPFGAIHINDKRLAEVDPAKCRACKTCIEACPRGVLKMLPLVHPVHRTCCAMERGKIVRENCSVGCVSCGKCERVCKFGALKMVDNLPEIDMDKCVGCMLCADNCPTGCLKANEALRKIAIIETDRCTGCGTCSEECKFEAILGETGGKHTVVTWNCNGCGACAQSCPEKCIDMASLDKHKLASA